MPADHRRAPARATTVRRATPRDTWGTTHPSPAAAGQGEGAGAPRWPRRLGLTPHPLPDAGRGREVVARIAVCALGAPAPPPARCSGDPR